MMTLDAFQDDRNLADDLGMFEAAVHARPLQLERPTLDAIVLALDGSNQDGTARAYANALAQRSGARIHEQPGAASARQILDVCAAHKANLLVIPVPFGRDINELKDESLGSVVDMLLLESACPVFCLREVMPADQVEISLADVVVPVHISDENCDRAVSWAFRILPRGGRLEILAVGDRDVLAEARKLMGETASADLPGEKVERALTQAVAGLVAAVQKKGEEEGLAVHVEIQVGRAGAVVLEQVNARPRLTVVAAAKDHTATSYHRAADIILGARGPVLVV